MSTLPKPLLTVDVDLSDLNFMPLDIMKISRSESWAMADGWQAKAMVNLWMKAWHQVPAGSLPANLNLIRTWAGVPNAAEIIPDDAIEQCRCDASKNACVVLRGWTLCDDGRLYHEVLCEKADEAFEKTKKYRKAAKARWKKKKLSPASHEQRTENASSDGYASDHKMHDKEKGREGKDINKKEDSDRGSPSSAPARDQNPPPQEPDGVGIPEVITAQSQPPTQSTESIRDMIEEAISLAQPLKFATKDSFNARQSINALIRQGADAEALRDLAGECHISQTTHGEFMTRAQKLLPTEIQSAINQNQEASHAQRARPVHDPIAAAANAARARARGT